MMNLGNVKIGAKLMVSFLLVTILLAVGGAV